jgi:diadenylate cyclase
MLIILAVSFLSYQLHFYTISFIIEKTLSVGILAVIVLFQPEFRRGLEKLGTNGVTGPINQFFGVEADTDTITVKSISEILDACETMSKQKTGALILIAQKVGVADLEETGIPIDAVITKQLIMNIFKDKAPLHDGAVIIKNNRISAAACHFANTEKEIGYELGTRHRAAVGASESTDAYIIVVSEETGNISVAHSGKLYKKLSIDRIRSMFVKEEAKQKQKIQFWRKKQ